MRGLDRRTTPAAIAFGGLADRVAALDGQLTVESPAGAGTKVTVELPLDGHGEVAGADD